MVNKAIRDAVGADANTVGKWRRRFAEHRLDGLVDEPRPGTPRKIGDDAIAETIRLTLETTPPVVVALDDQCRGLRAVYHPPHLARLRAAAASHRDHLVMDNYATHKTKPIRDWLAKRPRWHVHFTPTGASRINQVERFFALITDRQIRRGIHTSTQQLENDIRAFIDAHNADPKPFRWTKSADDILAAIQRFCQRT